MAGKKSKKFRVATEGATVDGRTIERAWIQQMADTYDPDKYRARVNLEHIKGTLPDGPFRNYGFVDAVEAAENSEGKLELFATITPTDDLVKMTAAMQKVFTSIEVAPNFAKTGKAYLQGLAVTDDPASLGTEMLEFTAKNPSGSPLTSRKQNPENHFSVAVETALEFIDEEQQGGPSILDRVRALFSRKDAADHRRFADVERAIEEIAEHGNTQSTETARKFDKVDCEVSRLSGEQGKMAARLDAMEKHFNEKPAPTVQRPRADGGAQHLTDF